MINQKITIHLPFSGSYPIRFAFGAPARTKQIQDIFYAVGLIGHNGIDYALPEDTQILAVDNGVVSKIATDVNFGLYITMKHRWGKSLYAHLKSTVVTESDKVVTGQFIGLSGQTGFATAPHLHFGIKPNNPNPKNGYLGYIDPTPYFS